MAVEIQAASTLTAGIPKALFQMRVPGLVDQRNHYVVTRDGRRFLVMTPVAESTTAQIHVVLN